MRGTERAGFTLIEVLLALLLAATLVAGARALVEGLSDQASTTARVARGIDEHADVERTLREVIGNLSIPDDSTPAFAGDEREARFASWCAAPRGGLEPCAARLSIVPQESGYDVLLLTFPGRRLMIRRGVVDARLLYLADASAGGFWLARWGAAVAAPVAVAVLTDSDTLLLRIGERR